MTIVEQYVHVKLNKNIEKGHHLVNGDSFYRQKVASLVFEGK